MQLSLEIIKRHLERQYKVGIYGEPHHELSLDRPKYYYPGLTFGKGGFCVIGCAMLESENWDGCFLICAGEDIQIPEYGYACLLAVENPNTGEILNSVNEIFDFYDKWDMSLKTLPKTTTEYVYAMLDASIPVFDNVIHLVNTNFQFEYVSDKEIEKTFNVQQPDESGFLPLDIVNLFKNDTHYNETNEIKTPYVLPVGVLPFRSLCANLFALESLIGRIVINETIRPFHETDLTLLAYLAGYIQDAYIDLLQTRAQPIFEMKGAIYQVLDGEDPGAAGLLKIIGKYNWTREDSYACLKFSSDKLSSPERHYVCRELEKHCKGTCAIEFDDNIAVVANLTLGGCSFETLVSRVEAFIKEGGYKVGVSMVFEDITNLRYHYLQARIAFETGRSSGSANWVFYFEGIRTKYLMGKCAEDLLPKFVCHAELTRLKQIDAETGTAYYESLSLYLKNCRNAVQTAEALFIHRLTLIYRLNRIKELTELKWDTPEEYFGLLLSINILENNNA